MNTDNLKIIPIEIWDLGIKYDGEWVYMGMTKKLTDEQKDEIITKASIARKSCAERLTTSQKESIMTCAKRHVSCKIETPEGFTAYGANYCENPQSVCPRLEGEDYTKCHTVCKQRGHAEIIALESLREKGLDPKGATATVRGHYMVCKNCAEALALAGITKIVIEVTP